MTRFDAPRKVLPSALSVMRPVASVGRIARDRDISNYGPLLLARITRRALRVLGFVPGQNAYAQIKAVSLIASASSGPLQPPAGRAEMI